MVTAHNTIDTQKFSLKSSFAKNLELLAADDSLEDEPIEEEVKEVEVDISP